MVSVNNQVKVRVWIKPLDGSKFASVMYMNPLQSLVVVVPLRNTQHETYGQIKKSDSIVQYRQKIVQLQEFPHCVRRLWELTISCRVLSQFADQGCKPWCLCGDRRHPPCFCSTSSKLHQMCASALCAKPLSFTVSEVPRVQVWTINQPNSNSSAPVLLQRGGRQTVAPPFLLFVITVLFSSYHTNSVCVFVYV